MLSFTLLVFVVFTFSWTVVRADLKHDLHHAGVKAYFPSDKQYSTAASPYNLRFKGIMPAAVVYPVNASQVSAAVVAGISNGVNVVSRSGGHSYIANGLGGKNGSLVIDTSKMVHISVKDDGSATIQTGNRVAKVATALNKRGRALPHGTCGYIGIGGHAGHGGFGRTSRQWGLTLDTITAAEIVLSNGTIVQTSKNKHSDLFWSIRGSASSFGIVTSYTVSTFPVPSSATVITYKWNLDPSSFSKAVLNFQDFANKDLPAQLGPEFDVGRGSSRGTVDVELGGVWYGDPSLLNSTLQPFLDTLPSPYFVSQQTGSYINSVKIMNGGTLSTSAPDTHDTFYAKSLVIPESAPLTNDALESWINYLATVGYDTDLKWFVQIELYGGSNSAINSVPLKDTSFGFRDALFVLQLYASSPNYQPPYPDHGLTFLDDMVNAIVLNMPQHWAYGAYLNYIDDRLKNWQKLYYGTHYHRLQQIKEKYDPSNVFHFPLSVEE
ncbi:FAD-binding domain-containing protein [Fistulina hepatica ATCC 64428]|uniref:FAD-binding domain-containing protein n=1 Tax=Fistulina hepatica ATCC 64428 TaxID=1128425 RepID=A0A0D7A6V6_9AGAR|nr:FAD-binding domain-containing protein [Fistulina hepatica ATCC 64428]